MSNNGYGEGGEFDTSEHGLDGAARQRTEQQRKRPRPSSWEDSPSGEDQQQAPLPSPPPLPPRTPWEYAAVFEQPLPTVNQEYLLLAETAAAALEARIFQSKRAYSALTYFLASSPSTSFDQPTSESPLHHEKISEHKDANIQSSSIGTFSKNTPSASPLPHVPRVPSELSETTTPASPTTKENATPNSTPLVISTDLKSTDNTTQSAYNKRSKKQKPVNPFRVKVGCIVAARHGKHEIHKKPNIIPLSNDSHYTNHHEDTMTFHLWAEPIPGVDDGLALLGRRVRCIFPKSAVSALVSSMSSSTSQQSNETNGNDASKKKKKICRILEGEVVSVLRNTDEQPNNKKRKRIRSQDILVGMLVSQKTLLSMPFLKSFTINTAEDEQNQTEGEKRRRKYEEIIRGKDNVIVKVTLADTTKNDANVIVLEKDIRENNNETPEVATSSPSSLVARWVIRKTISIRSDAVHTGAYRGRGGRKRARKSSLSSGQDETVQSKRKKEKDVNNGKAIDSSSSLYLGDVNDKPSQQEKNWRWWAGSLSYHSWKKRRIRRLSRPGSAEENKRNDNDDYNGCIVAEDSGSKIINFGHIDDGILIGEVLKVVPSPISTSTKINSTAPSTLAMVTLRGICIPEHTFNGRVSHHSHMEVFEINDPLHLTTSAPNQKANDLRPEIGGIDKTVVDVDANSLSDQCYQVPVEDLIVISRRLERQQGQMSQFGRAGSAPAATSMNANSLIMARSYSFMEEFYTQIDHRSKNENAMIENNSSNTHDSVMKEESVDNGDAEKKTFNTKNQYEICHRCHRKEDASKMKLCSSESCSSRRVSSDPYDIGFCVGNKSWWCGDCCRSLRNVGVFCLYQHLNWMGPCCLGVCDCRECSMSRRAKFNDLNLSNEVPDTSNEREDALSNMKSCSGCFLPCAKGFICCSSCSNLQHKDCCVWDRALACQDLLLSNGKCAISPSEESVVCTSGEEGSPMMEGCANMDSPNKTIPSVNGCHMGRSKTSKKIKKRNNEDIQNGFTCRNCFHTEKREATSTEIKVGLFHELHESVIRACPLEFELPADLTDDALNLSFEPISLPLVTKKKKHTVDSKKQSTTKLQAKVSKKRRSKGQKPSEYASCSVNESGKRVYATEDVFKPTCCRLLPYDPHRKLKGEPGSSKDAVEVQNSHRREAMKNAGRKNARAQDKSFTEIPKKISSRAARANQRRMLKDVASFGASKIALDKLSGCEQQLRFGKSLIHGWGVFADEGISAGDLIVEYRGELIGNAVADKREKEYEKAKIGSDYMFRIDNNIVCDATKQGNVARFINASCSPNCYTQIITINGCKRIAIYAQRDIRSGEELCYDYKFPLEYDEEKRIECHCTSPDCRGFMNWDKKYVIIPKGTK